MLIRKVKKTKTKIKTLDIMGREGPIAEGGGSRKAGEPLTKFLGRGRGDISIG